MALLEKGALTSCSSTPSSRASDTTSGQTSTQPSSPLTKDSTDMVRKPEDEVRSNDVVSMEDDEEEDLEDVDGKAKALTNLLKTSSVSSAPVKY